MDNQHGIPKRIIKEDEPGKTREFLRSGTVSWLLCCLLYVILSSWKFEIDNSHSFLVWLQETVMMVLLVGVTSIPIILFFALGLKIMERVVEKILNRLGD